MDDYDKIFTLDRIKLLKIHLNEIIENSNKDSAISLMFSSLSSSLRFAELNLENNESKSELNKVHSFIEIHDAIMSLLGSKKYFQETE